MQTDFSTVSAGRVTETLTSTQFVDVETLRFAAEVGRAIPRGYVAAIGDASRHLAAYQPHVTQVLAHIDSAGEQQAPWWRVVEASAWRNFSNTKGRKSEPMPWPVSATSISRWLFTR